MMAQRSSQLTEKVKVMRDAIAVVIAAVGLLTVFSSTPAEGEPVMWRVEDGGNGHRYEAVSAPGIDWSDAKIAAENAGGYLATISSEPENDFVFSLINSPEFWSTFTYRPGPVHIGPWLGGFQSPGARAPDEDWQWVTGEPFDFTNWQPPVPPFHPGEPNDSQGVNGDRLGYASVFTSEYQPFWNDASDTIDPDEFPPGYVAEEGELERTPKGFVVEFSTFLQAGDADQDLDFDQLDLVKVQVAAKYLSGMPATWGQGDWNGAPGGSQGNPPPGDGLFNQFDIIAAQQAGKYLTGPYASIRPGGTSGDGQTSVIYDPGTGELAVDAPAGTELTSINIDSAAAIFTGQAAQNLGGSFDNDADGNIFKATFGSSFGSLTFGNVTQPGLSQEFMLGAT